MCGNMAIPLPHLCTAAITYVFLSIPMCTHVGVGLVTVPVRAMDTEVAGKLVQAESVLLSAEDCAHERLLTDVCANVADLDEKQLARLTVQSSSRGDRESMHEGS